MACMCVFVLSLVRTAFNAPVGRHSQSASSLGEPLILALCALDRNPTWFSYLEQCLVVIFFCKFIAWWWVSLKFLGSWVRFLGMVSSSAGHPSLATIAGHLWLDSDHTYRRRHCHGIRLVSSFGFKLLFLHRILFQSKIELSVSAILNIYLLPTIHSSVSLFLQYGKIFISATSMLSSYISSTHTTNDICLYPEFVCSMAFDNHWNP